ncbi:MAG: hypothetical protein ABIH37_02965 [archaeon]
MRLIDRLSNRKAGRIVRDGLTGLALLGVFGSNYCASSYSAQEGRPVPVKETEKSPSIDYVPGKTPDLDEVRLYTGKFSEKDEKRLNLLVKEKGISYNSKKGYVIITPENIELRELYKSFKHLAIMTRIGEDWKTTLEEKEYVREHAPDLYKELYEPIKGPKQGNKKKKSNSKNPGTSSKVRLKFKSLQRSQIEAESGKISIELLNGIFNAGEQFLKNQKKASSNCNKK